MRHVPAAGQQFSFHAVLENWAEGMDYCAIAVPVDITEALGTKGPVLVLARVDDSKPFQVSLFPVGGGRHYVRIKARVRQETATGTGDRIRMQITVLDRSRVAIPDDLAQALRAQGVAESFRSLPPGEQNYIVRRIDQPARPQTRERRIQQAVESARQRREKRDRGMLAA
ncbi:YdeI/OmpD-associated family protein [Comamonadaceae bacterium G21597-S1]|nr:YdeI/OmpD-associated family protein [Comamonadaceae bacterium G21597-S1]